jgi:hypothetical protein
MNLHAALTIQNPDNDIRCEGYGQDRKTKKWAGAINLYHDGHFHTTLLSSESVFDSEEAAIKAMEGVVSSIRAIDLEPQKKHLEALLGGA